MSNSTLILICLTACVAVSLAQFTVRPQICSETRTRRAWGIRRMCAYRRTCYGPRKYCYNKCYYFTQPYQVPVCCPGYKRYPYCNVPICSPKCENNGLCVAKDKCDCPSGTAGPTCTSKTCGGNQQDCYPGSCITSTTKCQCASGYSGPNCQTMKEGPIFEKCVISLLDNSTGSYQVLETTECAPNNENRTEIYTNKRDFSHVGVDVIQTYADFEDTPDYPIDGVLSKVQVGLIKADATITLQKTDGGSLPAIETDCSAAASRDNSYKTIPCDRKVPFTTGVKHLQQLDVVLAGTTGGKKVLIKTDGSGGSIPKYYTGQSAEQSVTFKFDLEPPYHCSEDDSCCSGSESCDGKTDAASYIPIVTLQDITNVPDVTLAFFGWADKNSQHFAYRYNVYKMTLNGEGKLQEDERPIQSGNFTLFDETDVAEFKLPAPGMYSILGEVIDFADNVRYCRALVMYANTNQAAISYNRSMTVSGRTNLVGRHHWLQDTSASVTIGWTDGYGNPYLESNKFLAPMRALSYNDSIDYTQGNLSTGGMPNKQGITKFQYSVVAKIQTPSGRKRRSITPPTQWVDVPGVEEQVTLPPLAQGEDMTFWVRAEDLMGNVVTDFAFIRADNTGPAASQLEFAKNVDGPRRGFFSSVNMIVVDSQSGVFQINSTIFETTGTPHREIGSASQPGQTMNDSTACVQSGDCICISSDECFAKVQSVFVDNCIFVEYMDVPIRFDAIVYNLALLSTPVSLELGNVSALSGIGEYPPPYGFRLKRSYGTGAEVTWFLPVACYPVMNIFIELEGGRGDMPKLGGDVIETELSGLVPNRMYTARVYAEYENRYQSLKVELEFDTGPADGYHTGLSIGAIVGIVVGVLLLIIIVIIVVLIVVRVKLRNKPAVPRRLTMVGENIRNRISRKFGHSVRKEPWDEETPNARDNMKSGITMNVAYTSGPKLRDFEDDIYAYGEMDTDPQATWKHSNDRMVLGKVLHTGRFAEIRSGTLKNKEGSRPVAVKILRDHTDDNVLLMKAKMNFLATTVPHHNNIVNFVGAITEGNLILLEYCDESLKDWLKGITKMTDEVEDNMTNFCTDVARGMEHLHENEIIHRRLGARNVLLKQVPMMGRVVAKVTGFGPMKGETAGDAGPERIPIKWMAPEQLGLGKNAKRPYDNATDVWSYGITVWEIYSKGKAPFPDLKHSQIKPTLDDGKRPPRPEECSEDLYDDVMMRCWEYKPGQRPTFSELRADLERLFHGALGGDDYYDDEYGAEMSYDRTELPLEYGDAPPTYSDTRTGRY